MTDTATKGFDLTVTKQLPASPEEVFAAWLNPDHLKQWIAPMGTASVPLLEPRVGGRYRIDMHGENDATYVHEGEYLELDSPQRLVFTWISDGTEQQASVVTIDLAESDGGTLLTLKHEKLPTTQSAEKHQGGWTAIAENLAKVLATKA